MRIHSVGGWGAITMGKNLALTAFELFGLHIKANPKYGSEKKGQPTTFYAVLAPEPVRLNAELKHVDVVLSPDPNVFRHCDPIAGLAEGGVFVIQSDLDPDAFWESLPARARAEIRSGRSGSIVLDAFAIASDEASEAEHRYRMQGAAFLGAFFNDLAAARHGKRPPTRRAVRGDPDAAAEEVRPARRGRRGGQRARHPPRLRRSRWPSLPDRVEASSETATSRTCPRRSMRATPSRARQSRALLGAGLLPLRDRAGRHRRSVRRDQRHPRGHRRGPRHERRAARGARTSSAAKCTGCAQCWMQCPDAAIPGLVNSVEEVLDAASSPRRPDGNRLERLRPIAEAWGKEAQKLLAEGRRAPVA